MVLDSAVPAVKQQRGIASASVLPEVITRS